MIQNSTTLQPDLLLPHIPLSRKLLKPPIPTHLSNTPHPPVPESSATPGAVVRGLDMRLLSAVVWSIESSVVAPSVHVDVPATGR